MTDGGKSFKEYSKEMKDGEPFYTVIESKMKCKDLIEQLIMQLSISDNPIQDLISLLK